MKQVNKQSFGILKTKKVQKTYKWTVTGIEKDQVQRVIEMLDSFEEDSSDDSNQEDADDEFEIETDLK